MTNINKQRGKQGEDIAKEFLIGKGLEFLDQNFTIWGGEIDLIMKHKDEIIFIEVKTRKAELVPLTEQISKKQQRTLIRSAEFWLRKNRYDENDWRIDVVGILNPDYGETKIEWIKDAIY